MSEQQTVELRDAGDGMVTIHVGKLVYAACCPTAYGAWLCDHGCEPKKLTERDARDYCARRNLRIIEQKAEQEKPSLAEELSRASIARREAAIERENQTAWSMLMEANRRLAENGLPMVEADHPQPEQPESPVDEKASKWRNEQSVPSWNSRPITIGFDADGDFGAMDHDGYSIIFSRVGAECLLAYLREHLASEAHADDGPSCDCPQWTEACESDGHVPDSPTDAGIRGLRDQEEQRRNFAYGNVAIDNPNATRQMIDAAAAELAASPTEGDGVKQELPTRGSSHPNIAPSCLHTRLEWHDGSGSTSKGWHCYYCVKPIPMLLHSDHAAEVERLQTKLTAKRNLVEPPAKCPITNRPFFMTIQHPTLGFVPTFGGPYDSYTLAERNDDGEFFVQKFDHDEGCWYPDEYENLCVLVVDADEYHELKDQLTSALAKVKELEGERDEARAKIKTVADAIQPFLLELASQGKTGIFATDAVAMLLASRDALQRQVDELRSRVGQWGDATYRDQVLSILNDAPHF